MLNLPIEKAISTTKERIKKLNSMSIYTVKDLLLYFPSRYEDFSQRKTILTSTIDEPVTLYGYLSTIYEEKSPKQQKTLIKAVFLDDDKNELDIVWFNQKYLLNMFKEGDRVVISGKIQNNGFNLIMQSPRIEKLSDKNVHTGRIIPIYPETEYLTSDWFREKIFSVLYISDFFEEDLPDFILKNESFLSKSDAIKQIHFPDSHEMLNKAKKRLSFEEIFTIQLSALKKKLELQNIPKEKKKQMNMNISFVNQFKNSLDFKLTNDQRIALYEILKDMEKPYPMHRLLEGDVGSGKTIVAFIAMLHVSYLYKYQSVFMAPTEILAIQQYESLKNICKKLNLDLKIELFIGSIKLSKKKEIKEGLFNGTVDIVIGTHALIQEDVVYKNLGFVVIDEQHRFGVNQRDFFKKFDYPHVLHMSATPIPRTMALVIYGDQDLSIIKEKPAGRKEIITKIVYHKHRDEIYNFCKDQMNKGRQMFVICPLIEDSENLEAKSVLEEYENLKNIFPQYKIAMIHGKMKEKDSIINDFKNGLYNILVSTSVVEVGIDIPNATIMIIEGAERFGLSQLHQFRGRIGRNDMQSYCFLFTSDDKSLNNERLKALEKTNNGFELAKIDLQLRGPGEVFGLRQSGIPDFKMADWNDVETIKKARKYAFDLLNSNYSNLN